MVTIAVIEKNQCLFPDLEKYAAHLLYREHSSEERKKIKEEINHYLWSTIEPYVKFVQIHPDDDFMTVVCNKLIQNFSDKNPDEFYYHTEASYSFPKRYLELIHCLPMWPEYQKDRQENINAIGCLFSLKHSVIENHCIVIANRYDLSAKHFVVMDSVTKEDILRVIRRRFFFSAILIKDQAMAKYYYQDPAYLISTIYHLGGKDTIEKLSVSHLKYNLVFYFQHDRDKYVNQIATRINGSFRLHGDVLMIHEMEENIFANLSIREAKRLNVLSYGRLYDRRLKDDEMHSIVSRALDENGKEIEKKQEPYWSRYIVVEKRMLIWKEKKNRCINCWQVMKKPIVCDRCYRVKFCSQNCQQEFHSYHQDECINPKSI